MINYIGGIASALAYIAVIGLLVRVGEWFDSERFTFRANLPQLVLALIFWIIALYAATSVPDMDITLPVTLLGGPLAFLFGWKGCGLTIWPYKDD